MFKSLPNHLKSLPNHPREPQLFVTAEHWGAKEIAETCPAKDKNTKMMQKRIENARRTRITDHVSVRKRKRGVVPTGQSPTETSSQPSTANFAASDQVATPGGPSLFLSPPPQARRERRSRRRVLRKIRTESLCSNDTFLLEFSSLKKYLITNRKL